MHKSNPAFIPRNHLIEAAIKDAEGGNFQRFLDLVSVLQRPYEEQPGFSLLAAPPQPGEEVSQTFCGT